MKTPKRDATAYVSFYLALLCLLAVIAFHYPQFLSNPQLRDAYDVDDLRRLLQYSLGVSAGLAVLALAMRRKLALALTALLFVAVAVALGGSTVPVQTPIEQLPLYLSLDLIILDLFFMSLLFVPFERLFWLRPQRLLRPGLATDLSHYGLNHLLMGGVMFLVSWPGNWVHANLLGNHMPRAMAHLPVWAQVPLILFVADFTQYWVHRAFHKSKRLWQFHKIHHSVQTMDWIAGSRLHIVDVVVTRALSYTPVVCLGFSEAAVHAYLPVVAIQAVYVHSNTRFELRWLKRIMTTPQVHHWHHSSQDEAIDKNFAVSFSFIDVLFGTYYCPDEWPRVYGLAKEKISEQFLRQLFYPFAKALPQSRRKAS